MSDAADQPPLPFDPPPRRAAAAPAGESAAELSTDRLTASLFEELARRAATLEGDEPRRRSAAHSSR